MNIERHIEDAFIEVFGDVAAISSVASIKRWKDAEEDAEYPCIAVHCSPVADHDGDPGGTLFTANVEVAAMVDTQEDKDGEILQTLAGNIRDTVRTGIVTSLNTVTGLDISFLDRGVRISTGGDHVIDDEDLSMMSFTLEVQVKST